MSGPTRTSAGLDPRRKRVLFRAWHRGIREMDLIMGRFADAEVGMMSQDDLAEFERLIEMQDRDLFRWITGEEVVPQDCDSQVFRRLKSFHAMPVNS